MIKVEVVEENNLYKKISILGHAMYDDYGKDIVCSAVSSIVTTTINGCIALDEGSLNYEVNGKGLFITTISNDKIIQTLINNMVSLLKELEEKYPTNIKVM
ncbi:MAG: ribosomal-processing cysteine protease Prp [Bacilli bacterium]|nr:ribosomal-processing cysteine protease Prp [Bacilli bacterium]